MKPSILLLVALIALVRGDDIYFNTESVCGTGCNFTDPTIWIGNIAPNSTDNAFIINNGTQIIFYADTIISINSLSVENVNFNINSLFSVTSTISVLGSQFNIEEGGNFVASSSVGVIFASGSILNIGSGSTFYIDLQGTSTASFDATTNLLIATTGTFSTNGGQVLLNGNISANINSTFNVYSATILSSPSVVFGTLASFTNVSLYAYNYQFTNGLNATYAYIDSYINVTVLTFANFYNGIWISQFSFLNVQNLIFDNNVLEEIKLSGSGTIAITSSTVWITDGATSAFTGQTVFYGSNTVYYEIVTLLLENVSFLPSPTGEAAAITIYAIEYLQLVSNSDNSVYSIPGSFSGDFVSLVGSFHFSGSLNTTGSVNVTGVNAQTPDITFDGPVYIGFYPSTFHLSGTITAPSITVSPVGILSLPHEYTPNPILIATEQLNVSGILSFVAVNTFVITGDYNQFSSAELHLINITANISLPIIVLGQASLAGLVRYRISDIPSNYTRYLILVAGNITGTFAEKPSSLLGETNLGLDYSEPHQVYLHPVSTPSNDDGGWFKWWYYLIIAGGVVIIAIIIIAVVVRRRRASYEPVR